MGDCHGRCPRNDIFSDFSPILPEAKSSPLVNEGGGEGMPSPYGWGAGDGKPVPYGVWGTGGVGLFQFEGTGVELVVCALRGDQIFVSASFDDPAVV